jgi:hypothetical protein
VQADRVLCWRIGDDTTLVLGAADPALPTPPASMPIGELLAGTCAADATPVSRGEGELPEAWREATRRRDGADPGAMLAIPLVRAGELVGVLETVRRPGRPAFTEAERQRFAGWGSQVATALAGILNTARLHEAQSDILAANAALEAKIELRTRAVVHAKREWERTFDAIREPIALQDGFRHPAGEPGLCRSGGRGDHPGPGEDLPPASRRTGGPVRGLSPGVRRRGAERRDHASAAAARCGSAASGPMPARETRSWSTTAT